MKRVWLSRIFSYIYEAFSNTNLAFFIQSLYVHTIGTFRSISDITKVLYFKHSLIISLLKVSTLRMPRIRKFKELCFIPKNSKLENTIGDRILIRVLNYSKKKS